MSNWMVPVAILPSISSIILPPCTSCICKMSSQIMASKICILMLFLFLTLRQLKGQPANAGTTFLIAVVDPGGLYTETELNPTTTSAAPQPTTTAASSSQATVTQSQGQTTAASGQGQGQTTQSTTVSTQTVSTSMGAVTTGSVTSTSETTATTTGITATTQVTTAAQKRKKRAVSDSTGLELHIVTSWSATVEVNVTSPLQNGLQTRRVQLTKGQVQVVKLSVDFTSAGGVGNKGIGITASHQVSVYVFGWSSGVAFSFAALPTNELGSLYYAVGYSPQGNGAKHVEKQTTAAPASAMPTSVTSQGSGITSQSSVQNSVVTSQPNESTTSSLTSSAATTSGSPTSSAPSSAKAQEGASATTDSSPTTAAAPLTDADACHFVLVGASAAATTVQIQLPSGVRCLHNGNPAASSFSFQLNAWQTNLLTCGDEVTGIKISSNKPVATYTGKRKTTNCQNEASMEQMWPTNVLGRKFFIPGAGMNKIVRILATKDTLVQISSGSSSQSMNLSTGTYTEWGATTSDVTITGNKQLYVVEVLLPASANADLALMTVVPMGQYAPNATFALTSKQTTTGNVAKVVFTTSDTSDFKLDGAAPSWTWSGTTNKYYTNTMTSGVFVMGQETQTKVVAAYATGNVGSGLWAFPVGFRLAPLWESCTPTTATPGDNLDNDCDGKIDEEKKDGKDEDSDSRTDEDTIYEEPKTTNTNSNPNDDKRKSKQLLMFIILGTILGGIPLVILTYLIVRALFCPVDVPKTESKVEIIGSQAQITDSEHGTSS